MCHNTQSLAEVPCDLAALLCVLYWKGALWQHHLAEMRWMSTKVSHSTSIVTWWRASVWAASCCAAANAACAVSNPAREQERGSCEPAGRAGQDVSYRSREQIEGWGTAGQLAEQEVSRIGQCSIYSDGHGGFASMGYLHGFGQP